MLSAWGVGSGDETIQQSAVHQLLHPVDIKTKRCALIIMSVKFQHKIEFYIHGSLDNFFFVWW